MATLPRPIRAGGVLQPRAVAVGVAGRGPPPTSSLGSSAAASGLVAAGLRRRIERRAQREGEEDADLARSLRQRTLDALDLDFILERLKGLCYTAMAAEMALEPEELLASSVQEARALYDMVLELTQLEDADLELEQRLDILPMVEQCARGLVLEPGPLARVSDAIAALLRLRNGLAEASARGVQIPKLMEYCEEIELPDQLLDLMLEAFQEDGELSLQKFPEIAQLRKTVRELEEQCSKVMAEVLSSGKYSAYLSDDGYMQFGGKYVLGVKPRFREKVGRMFDESRSGKTAYVEPFEVIECSDGLSTAKKDLQRMVRRILGKMCLAVSNASEALRRCLRAAAHIDLARARLFLGEDMEGEVPYVGKEGIIECRQARNPCLVLRGGMRVVGYRLELGSPSQCLMLTGPNAGGKTVVLKTLGLLALLARCGIPIPGGESPRVDFFEVVLADVGDMQTIVDDLSTYSAHLVASRIMLSTARSAGQQALVLVDEAATGTDPQQGAALARAMMEGFLDMGARIVTTTHSNQLKDWAMEDPRTMTAAMEYKQGRPTYRLTTNAVGESHAIDTAQRLGLPQPIVQRAEQLLSADMRQLLALQRDASAAEQDYVAARLDAEEREAVAQRAILEAEAKETELQQRALAMAQTEEELKQRMEALERQMQAELQARVAVKERQFEDVVTRLKMEAQQFGTRLRIVGDALEDLRIEVNEEEMEAPGSDDRPAVPGAMSSRDKLGLGDWVIVLADPPWHGLKGSVEKIHLTDNGSALVSVRLGATGKLKEFYKTQLKKTAAPPQSALKKQKVKGEAVPQRNYSSMMF